MCIHHSATNDEQPQFARVFSYHNSGAGGKFPRGFGIQYHFFGERDGTRIQSRPIDQIAYHAGSAEWNEKSFAYCFAGDMRSQTPTKAQMSSLFSVWKDSGFPSVVYHKEVRPDPTACPGSFAYREELEKLRQADLVEQLKRAEKVFARYKGTRRGNLLERLIERLKRIVMK